ncbi:Mrx3 protein [Starmerella bacillaris]|uniref:Mrx3 protein n=1 Tax=Starmerella bacillaris TaxID=1247836 RepID=A0AAV5RMJ1_STABA|nr:Mrx3 protein [Starmerella bacillaris]
MLRKLGFTGAMFATTATGWTMGNSRLNFYEEEASTKYLLAKPEVKDYLKRLEAKGFEQIESRKSWLLESHRKYMFTQAVLTGPMRLHPEGPITLKNPETDEIVNIFHVGAELKDSDHFKSTCTTLFDECLAQAAFTKLPNHVGVTANLKLGPVQDLPNGEDIVALHALPTSSKGRKVETEGTITSLVSDKVLAKGSALLVEPKWGKYVAWLAL